LNILLNIFRINLFYLNSQIYTKMILFQLILTNYYIYIILHLIFLLLYVHFLKLMSKNLTILLLILYHYYRYQQI